MSSLLEKNAYLQLCQNHLKEHLLSSSWEESGSCFHPYTLTSLLLLISALESDHKRTSKDYLLKKLYGDGHYRNQ
jgi:hypothetical protein